RLAVRRVPGVRLPALADDPVVVRPLPVHRAGRGRAAAVVLLRVPGAALGARAPRHRAVRAGRRMTDAPRPVLVVDFGAQYAQLIARRVREAGVYSEIVPHTITAAELAARNPVGIVLSGGPSSV